MISLLNPIFALGGAGLGVCILLIIYLRQRRITVDVIRAALVSAFLGLALSHPGISDKRSEDSSRLTALIDVSKSFGENAMVDDVIAKLPPGTRCVAFDETARDVECNARAVASSKTQATKTSLISALSMAHGEVVLLSDARENLGSAEAMLGANRDKVTVYPIVTEIEQPPVRIAQVTYPPFIRALQKFSIGIAVSDVSRPIASEHGLVVTVKRATDPTAVVQKHIDGVMSENSTALTTAKIDFDFVPAQNFKGLEEFTVTVSDKDGKEIDSKIILIGSNSEKNVLVVSSQEALATPLIETLREQGFNVVPSSNGAVAELANFRAVILINTARADLASGFENRVATYVKSGGTLITTGGPRSFVPGGYKGSIIGDLLPVNLLPPETVQKRLSVAVALVLDKSGSMAQGEKLDGAKGAAREVVQNLKDEDSIAIIGFDDAPFVVLRASQVGQVRGIAAERIGRLFPAGRTNLIPALDEARRMLVKIDAGRKHVIVMTDGRLPDEGQFYFELLRDMRLAGITASTVLLGGENDFSFLKQMAEVGGGGFYQTSDPRLLPRIFLQDIKVSVDAPTPPGTYQVRELKPLSVRLGTYPELTAVSPAAVKPNASLELAVLDGGDRGLPNMPLLASWSVSNGRSLAFMADMVGQQSVAWFRWSKLGEFWRQIISQESGPKDGASSDRKEPSIEFTVEQRGEYAALNVTVYDAPSKSALEWRVANPDGTDVGFKQFTEVFPGRYRAIIKTLQSGKYTVRAADWLPPFGFAVREADFVDSASETTDIAHLRRLAAMTGGVLFDANDLSGLSKISMTRKSLDERTDYTWLACLLAFVCQLVGMLFRSAK